MIGSSIKRTALAFLVLTFLVLNVGGGVLMSHMMMGDGAAHDCPFMGVPALCDMTPLAHLSQWQMMFAAVAQQTTVLVFLFCITLFALWRLSESPAPLTAPLRAPLSTPRYRRRAGSPRIFDTLYFAFARGIVHSKAF